MPNDRVRIFVLGEAKVGKSELVNCLIGKESNDNYVETYSALNFYNIGSELFHIHELPGNKSLEALRKKFEFLYNNEYVYTSRFIIIYALDATEDANKNKKILQDFQTEISETSKPNFLSNSFQLIVFTKSDDQKSKLSQEQDLSQDYLKEFDSLKFPIIVSSAKKNTGFTEINKALLEFCSNQSSTTATKQKEESLVSAIEDYSKRLSKKNSQLAKSKATALEAIAKVCRDVGVGQHPGQPNPGCLSKEQILKIKNVILGNKTIISQHRHSSCFNWFFNRFDASRLAKRVTSHELVNKLDTYLALDDNLETISPANH